MQKAVDYIRKAGLKTKRIAAEFGFLPYDASHRAARRVPRRRLGRRAVRAGAPAREKIADELAKLKIASEAVIDVHAGGDRQVTARRDQADVVEALRREETNRGLTFEYCLITCGTSLNRAPSDQKWEKGDIMSIDSGGNYHGYIGDVCRMAIQGEPDAELEDLLAEIESIQRAAMKPMRAGAMGREIYAAAEPLVAKSKHHNQLEFLAPRHGAGQPRGAAAHRPRPGAVSGD